MENIHHLFGLNKLKYAVFGVFLGFVQVYSFAQPQYYVNISTVQVIAPYSPNLSSYVNNPSKVIMSVSVAAGAPAQKIKLFATLQGDNGIVIKTNASALSGLPEISLSAGSPVQVLNSLYIRNLFDLTSVDIQGTTLNYLQTYGLPTGGYTLCVQAVTAETNPATGA